MYEIEFSKEAVKHVLVMRKSSPQLFKKLEKLLDAAGYKAAIGE